MFSPSHCTLSAEELTQKMQGQNAETIRQVTQEQSYYAQKYCAKLISINSQHHQQYLLTQMAKALLKQKQKLHLLLKIKLQKNQLQQLPRQKEELRQYPQKIIQQEIDNLSNELLKKKSEYGPVWELDSQRRAKGKDAM